MSILINQKLYENEINFVKKYDKAACALDQLNKIKTLPLTELHKIVNSCLNEKTSKTNFEQFIKSMILTGLVIEAFTKDQKFRIRISSIGKDVHKTIKSSDKHLVKSHF